MDLKKAIVIRIYRYVDRTVTSWLLTWFFTSLLSLLKKQGRGEFPFLLNYQPVQPVSEFLYSCTIVLINPFILGQDFSNSPPVEIVLSGSARGILSAPIPISDDEINELEEGFIVVLEVASAVDPALVDLSGRNTALFRIRDNDGKLKD